VDNIANEIQSIASFDQMNLSDEILRGIYAAGYEKPSAIQAKAIVPTKSGRDIIAQAQSGTGKTLTFSIGILEQLDFKLDYCQALILAPTRELALQIRNVIDVVGDYCNVKTQAFIGGTSIKQDIKNSQSFHVAIGTPGRILHLLSEGHLDPSRIKCFILDEADKMLSEGFKEQVYDTFQHLPGSMQVGLFSATMSPEVLELTQRFMKDPIRILAKREEVTLEGIKQFYINVEHEEYKLPTLIDLYDRLSLGQTVIFCNTRKTVIRVTEQLEAEDFTISAIHADLEQAQREKIMQQFKTGASRILITTDLVERGIDVHGVSMVINFDIPRRFESYIHRIGRAARFGRKGVAINFVTRRDYPLVRQIESFYSTEIQEMPADISKYL